jgi:4-alpha-glucanotransferase
MARQTRKKKYGSAPSPATPLGLERRAAGVLLHVTSLPGPHGNGDLGPAARQLVDFLASAGQRWWQMLPVNPAGAGNSPYSGVSAFAGNPLLISLQDLVDDGLLSEQDVAFRLPARRADYERATVQRTALLRTAFSRHERRPRLARELERFRGEAAYWLPDYALYMALRTAQQGRRWTEWPRELRQREPRALARARRELAREVAYFELEQLLFHRQWARLRQHAREQGVGLIGDAPIFIAHESADVWANPRLFQLDARGEPTHVAGVPPDYFCKTGQRWGNPLYRWRHSRSTGHRWWVERFRTLLWHFDVVRLDHFIGYSRFWQIPAHQPTAEHGTWQPAPGQHLFQVVHRRLGHTPFIAEDLGEVTDQVLQLRDDFQLPGMRILQFAFGNDTRANAFLPHRFVPNTVAYTGTHDNDTFVGWFADQGSRSGPRSARQASKERRAATQYLLGPGAEQQLAEPHWQAVRAVYASAANTVIVPLQDLLGLDNSARMNSPGSAEGNWEWRLAGALPRSLARRLRDFTATFGRQLEPSTAQG